MKHLFLLKQMFFLFLVLSLSLSVASQSIAGSIISVKVGHLHFNLPEFLTNPVSSVSISSSLKFPYRNKQIIVMQEEKLPTHSGREHEFDESAECYTKTTLNDDGQAITQSFGHIMGYPFVLTTSYTNKRHKGELFQLANMIIKIKMTEGIISFRTWRDDPVQTDLEQFFEDEKVQFLKWVELLMLNYKWIGDHSINQTEGFKTQYGLIKNNGLTTSSEFNVTINYHEKDAITDILILSDNPWRYRMIIDMIFKLARTMLNEHSDRYYLRHIKIKHIKERNGVEVALTTEHGAIFCWLELAPWGIEHYTSIDISGEIQLRSSPSSEFKETVLDPVTIWNHVTSAL